MSIEDLSIRYSNGYGHGGKVAAYITPVDCFNNSRRITGCDRLDLKSRIEKACLKWYSPLHYYRVDGHVIGSNNPKNALLEYWRVCDRDKMNRPFPVELIEPEAVPELAAIEPGIPTLDRQNS